MKHIKRTFLKGLITVIPIAATIGLFVWFVTFTEKLAGQILKYLLPDVSHLPGMGVLFAFLLIFVIGLALNAWITRRLLKFGEDILNKIPFIKTIYASMKDLVGFFSAKNTNGMNSVVLVDIGGGRKVLGLITRENFQDEKELDKKNLVSVYMPMSYQLGGFTIFMSKNQVEEINIPVDKALSQTLTGWVQKSKQPQERTS